MPTRRIHVAGQDWSVFPSGQVTQYDGDEFGLLFVRVTDDAREVRVTRYSPRGVRSREASLMAMNDAELHSLFAMSQSSENSPEAGYAL
ncbi:MAG: hypothetical protein WCL36_05460 [bacterium]|jgi:hypothetical protein